MALYLNQLIPKRGSNNYLLDVGLGAKVCHQSVISGKTVSLLKRRSLCITSERKHPLSKALKYPLMMEIVGSVKGY